MNSSSSASNPLHAELLAPLKKLLDQIIQFGGFEWSYVIRQGPPVENSEATGSELVVDFSGPDAALLLERNGALLDALEQVLLTAARLREGFSGQVVFDCQDWRSTRARELQLMARLAAEQVSTTGARMELSPMNARERRIVHLALKDHPRVRTLSEGSGPDRRVVVLPAPPAAR